MFETKSRIARSGPCGVPDMPQRTASGTTETPGRQAPRRRQGERRVLEQDREHERGEQPEDEDRDRDADVGAGHRQRVRPPSCGGRPRGRPGRSRRSSRRSARTPRARGSSAGAGPAGPRPAATSGTTSRDRRARARRGRSRTARGSGGPGRGRGRRPRTRRRWRARRAGSGRGPRQEPGDDEHDGDDPEQDRDADQQPAQDVGRHRRSSKQSGWGARRAPQPGIHRCVRVSSSAAGLRDGAGLGPVLVEVRVQAPAEQRRPVPVRPEVADVLRALDVPL